MTEEIMNAISSEVYGVWFLIGAALGTCCLLYTSPSPRDRG